MVLYLKCVIAGLVALILVCVAIFVFVAGLLFVGIMAGFGFEFEKPQWNFGSLVFWLVAIVVFGAGFLWEHRRLSR